MLAPETSPNHYLRAVGVEPVDSLRDSAAALEAQGWRIWLTTVFPFAFPSEFAPFHCQFWDLWWEVCLCIKHGRPVSPELQNFLLLWGRALAKSSSGTPSSLMKAALSGRTYSIYLSETIDQATSHLANIRYLIEHPDSKLIQYYPHLALESKLPTALGLKAKDTETVFITHGGSIFRALSIASAARGLILGGKRPDDFNIDDIDDISHGVVVANKHLQRLTRSILLTRDIASDLVVTTKILQNIVIEHGVVNQIHSGKSDAFAERTTIGVINTFEKLDTETYVDTRGKLRHRILPTSIPSWSAVSIQKAQSILDLIGLDAFLAECQNEFDRFKAGKVIPEYNEEAQIITWSMFESVFGERRIPANWQVKVGFDRGYTEGLHPHYSAWVFVATAAMNSELPRSVFLYRARAFKGTSIDDQAETIKSEMYEDERSMVRSWQMSHEGTSEMMTLNQKYQLPFYKFRYYKAEDGVPQWRHLSKADKSKPHPFKDDEKDADGNYWIGRPKLFYIVDDDQELVPHDDRGLALFREQVANWNYVPVKLTENGLTQQKPSKVNDDLCDAMKGVLALFGANATALTHDERIIEALPPQFRPEAIAAETDGKVKEKLHYGQTIALAEAERKINKPKGNSGSFKGLKWK